MKRKLTTILSADVVGYSRLMGIDPYRPDLYGNNLGIALHAARRYAEAIAALKRITSLRYPHYAYLAACHAQLGDGDEAKANAARVLDLRPDFSVATHVAAEAYKNRADQEHLRDPRERLLVDAPRSGNVWQRRAHVGRRLAA